MTSPAKMLSPLAWVWPGLEKTINKGLGVEEPPAAAPAPTINIPETPVSTPARMAGSKPGKRTTNTPSYLAAVSFLPPQTTGTGKSGGKTLLGQ